MVARDIMTREVLSVRPDASAKEAAELLLRTGRGAIPVVSEDGVVVGVVSFQDLIRLALPAYLDDVDLSFLPEDAGFFPAGGGSDCLADTPVEAFMREGYLPQVPQTEPIAEIARIMLAEQARRVVVVEDGKLVGIVSRGDVVRAIVQPAVDSCPEKDS